jgi:hypothetical protein
LVVAKGRKLMANLNVGEPDTYTMLTTCMARGAHVELTLRGGETGKNI